MIDLQTATADQDSEAPENVVLVRGRDAGSYAGVLDGLRRLVDLGRVAHFEALDPPQGAGRGYAQRYWDEVMGTVLNLHATVVIFQYFHSPQFPDPGEAIRKIKRLPSKPIVVSTLGDAFMNGYAGRPSVPSSFLSAARESDLITSTSLGALSDAISRNTAAPIILMPHGICQVTFNRPDFQGVPESRQFDVVFVGSRNQSRNPLRAYTYFGLRRSALVRSLSRRFGRGFAVFGDGWGEVPGAQGSIPYNLQNQAARMGRVVVGGIPFSRNRYYMSDRPFIQIGSGVPFVDAYVAGVETLFRPDQHWYLAREGDLVAEVERVLEMDEKEAFDRSMAAANLVFASHTMAHRVAALLENARRLRRNALGVAREAPFLPYFLEGVDLTVEAGLATRNWPVRQG